MTTRSGSDKEQIEEIYQTAIENQDKPKRTRNITAYTSTSSGPSTITPRSFDHFTLYDLEASLRDIDKTLVPGSDGSSDSGGCGDDTIKPLQIEPIQKPKKKKIMAHLNPFATLKYAVEAVPFFDKQNIPLSYFIEGCEEAKSMLIAKAETQFARIIRTRIVGEVHRTI